VRSGAASRSRRAWTGPELAERLGVGVRTIRRDVDRLRQLGYPVHAAPGVAGGYRLGAGAELPPLLLDDDEAVAVAVGLRTAAGGTVAGIEETSVRALARLEQVLPNHLRRRVNALKAFTVPALGSGPTVDPDTLATIASARFTARKLPASDLAAYVSRAMSSARDRYQARVILHAPLNELQPRVPPSYGSLEPRDAGSCILHTGSDWLGGLAVYIAEIGVDFRVLEPPELAERVRELADRFARAAAG
jgi:predicted DNA-binding transcriptional regulator YafY